MKLFKTKYKVGSYRFPLGVEILYKKWYQLEWRGTKEYWTNPYHAEMHVDELNGDNK